MNVVNITDTLDLQLYKNEFPDSFIKNTTIIHINNINEEIHQIYDNLNYSQKYVNEHIKLILQSNFAGITIFNNDLNIPEAKIIIFEPQESTLWHELVHIDDFQRYIFKNNYNNISFEDFIRLSFYKGFLLYTEIRAHNYGIYHSLEMQSLRNTMLGVSLKKPDISLYANSYKVIYNKMNKCNQKGDLEGFIHAIAEFLGTWIAYMRFFNLEDEIKYWFSICSNGAFRKIFDFSLEIKDKKADELTTELEILNELLNSFITYHN